MNGSRDPWETALQLFGETVRLRRRELGLRQLDLAERTGLNISHIGQIEKGNARVNLESLFLIASALQVSPSTLLQPLSDRRDLYPHPKKGD